MTTEEQIKALAELDGITPVFDRGNNCWCSGYSGSDMSCVGFKPYLTSYDAIIPLIQKQPKEVQWGAWQFVADEASPFLDTFNATPTQLCEALLRATGKWKESDGLKPPATGATS